MDNKQNDDVNEDNDIEEIVPEPPSATTTRTSVSLSPDQILSLTNAALVNPNSNINYVIDDNSYCEDHDDNDDLFDNCNEQQNDGHIIENEEEDGGEEEEKDANAELFLTYTEEIYDGGNTKKIGFSSPMSPEDDDQLTKDNLFKEQKKNVANTATTTTTTTTAANTDATASTRNINNNDNTPTRPGAVRVQGMRADTLADHQESSTVVSGHSEPATPANAFSNDQLPHGFAQNGDDAAVAIPVALNDIEEEIRNELRLSAINAVEVRRLDLENQIMADDDNYNDENDHNPRFNAAHRARREGQRCTLKGSSLLFWCVVIFSIICIVSITSFVTVIIVTRNMDENDDNSAANLDNGIPNITLDGDDLDLNKDDISSEPKDSKLDEDDTDLVTEDEGLDGGVGDTTEGIDDGVGPLPPTGDPDEDDPMIKLYNLIEANTYNPDTLQDTTSPQYMALDWLKTNKSHDMQLPRDGKKILQYYGLVTFYYSTNGKQWINSNKWLSNSSVCQWFSSAANDPCRGGKFLKELNLVENGLSGSIPPEIALLDALDSITLNDNNFMDSSQGIPSEIGLLTNLIRFEFDCSDLMGTIPSEIGSMISLKYLNLSHNNLIGSIPLGLGQLQDLETLKLGHNELTEHIPRTLGNLQNLVTFEVDSNLLTGTIPSQLSSWHGTIHHVELDRNLFFGSSMEDVFCVPGYFASSNNDDYTLEVDCKKVRCACATNCFGGDRFGDRFDHHF